MFDNCATLAMMCFRVRHCIIKFYVPYRTIQNLMIRIMLFANRSFRFARDNTKFVVASLRARLLRDDDAEELP